MRCRAQMTLALKMAIRDFEPCARECAMRAAQAVAKEDAVDNQTKNSRGDAERPKTTPSSFKPSAAELRDSNETPQLDTTVKS